MYTNTSRLLPLLSVLWPSSKLLEQPLYLSTQRHTHRNEILPPRQCCSPSVPWLLSFPPCVTSQALIHLCNCTDTPHPTAYNISCLLLLLFRPHVPPSPLYHVSRAPAAPTTTAAITRLRDHRAHYHVRNSCDVLPTSPTNDQQTVINNPHDAVVARFLSRSFRFGLHAAMVQLA